MEKQFNNLSNSVEGITSTPSTNESQIQKLAPRYENGIPLEYAKKIFYVHALGFGSKYKHNNLDPKKYPNEKRLVVDGVFEVPVIFQGIHYAGVLSEDTNPKKSTIYSDEIIESKIEYFKKKDPEHKYLWSLTVSHFNFSKKIKEKIENLRICLDVLNLTATKDNIHQIIRVLFCTRLYFLLKPYSPRLSKDTKQAEEKFRFEGSAQKELGAYPQVSLHYPIEYYSLFTNHLYRFRKLTKKEEIRLVLSVNNVYKSYGPPLK